MTALPDGSFLRQIWIVDLKVIWQAKNIFGGLQISGGFLADFDQFCMGLFLSDGSGGFWRFWICISKNQLISHFFLHFLEFIICQEIKIIFLQIILRKKKISF
jgi:hypothetical protein